MWQIRRILTRFSNCGGMSPIVVGLAGETRLSSRNRKSDMNCFFVPHSPSSMGDDGIMAKGT